jgi:serine/threonine-protein kinase
MMMKRKPKFQPGDRFLLFVIIRLLGQGGVGEVYEILFKGKGYALKIIQSKWLNDQAQVNRMLDEGAITRRFNHPHVVNVHEFSQAPDGTVWIRMDLLQGLPLDALIRSRGSLSIPTACAYLHGAGLGVYQCHVLGAIHRDIKLANLFVTLDDVVKLLDFGLAKIVGTPETADGHRHGTPLYMAPEQIRGERLTPAADVYSLGIVAYEALTGINPFGSVSGHYNIHTLYHRQLDEVPEHLSAFGVPRQLADVIAQALAKNPRDRPPDGRAFAKMVWSAFLAIEESEPDSETYPGEPPIERIRALTQDGLRFGTGPVSARRPVVLVQSAGVPQRPAPLHDPERGRAFADTVPQARGRTGSRSRRWRRRSGASPSWIGQSSRCAMSTIRSSCRSRSRSAWTRAPSAVTTRACSTRSIVSCTSAAFANYRNGVPRRWRRRQRWANTTRTRRPRSSSSRATTPRWIGCWRS